MSASLRLTKRVRSLQYTNGPHLPAWLFLGRRSTRRSNPQTRYAYTRGVAEHLYYALRLLLPLLRSRIEYCRQPGRALAFFVSVRLLSIERHRPTFPFLHVVYVADAVNVDPCLFKAAAMGKSAAGLDAGKVSRCRPNKEAWGTSS